MAVAVVTKSIFLNNYVRTASIRAFHNYIQIFLEFKYHAVGNDMLRAQGFAISLSRILLDSGLEWSVIDLIFCKKSNQSRSKRLAKNYKLTLHTM
jgi:hypothetical protein